MPRWVKPALIVLAFIIGGTVLWWQMNQDESLLRLDGHSYHITVMRTDAELQKGLSDTSSLPAGQAMVFVFPRDDKWAMWMKDMKYPIDIVWLNDNKQVIDSAKNAQPSSYPQKFTPSESARYVIEFPSGTVANVGIQNGDPVGLPSGV